MIQENLKESELTCSRCGKIFDVSNLISYNESNDSSDTIMLCETCYPKLQKELTKQAKSFTGPEAFKRAAHEIFKGLNEMGLDTDDVNFKDTPQRFARALYEIFEGVTNTKEEVKKILATSFPADGMNNMITAKGIIAFSMCPHHLLPVEYKINVGYVPAEDGNVLGISKLSRLVKLLAKQPLLQETLCEQIADALASIGVKGSAVAISGRHMCMRMRGVKDVTASIYAQSMRGCFKDDAKCRQEFLELTRDGLIFN